MFDLLLDVDVLNVAWTCRNSHSIVSTACEAANGLVVVSRAAVTGLWRLLPLACVAVYWRSLSQIASRLHREFVLDDIAAVNAWREIADYIEPHGAFLFHDFWFHLPEVVHAFSTRLCLSSSVDMEHPRCGVFSVQLLLSYNSPMSAPTLFDEFPPVLTYQCSDENGRRPFGLPQLLAMAPLDPKHTIQEHEATFTPEYVAGIMYLHPATGVAVALQAGLPIPLVIVSVEEEHGVDVPLSE